MKEDGVSFTRALGDAIREDAGRRTAARYETPTFEMGVPAVDLTKALRIAGELEDDLRVKPIRGASNRLWTRCWTMPAVGPVGVFHSLKL